MPSKYPGALATSSDLPINRSNASPQVNSHPADHNQLAMEIIAVEAELGLLPKGSHVSVRDRLDVIEFISTSQQATNYTLVLADNRKVVEINSASSTIVTIPTNAVAAYPVGTRIKICQMGVGAVTIAAAGGVTLHSYSGFTMLAGQYAQVELRKRATDEWVMVGDLKSDTGGVAFPVGIHFGTHMNLWGSGQAGKDAVNTFFSGSTKPRWIREDQGDFALPWAADNGVSVLGIIYLDSASAGMGCPVVELGNEPYFNGTGSIDDNWHGYGSCAIWATHARDCAKAIKAAYPTKKVLLPLLVQVNNGDIYESSSWQPMVTVIQNATAADNIWQYVDGYGIHPYAPDQVGSWPASTVDHVRTQLEAIPAAAGKPFWATEWGWTTGGTGSVTEAEQKTLIDEFIADWQARTDVQVAFQYMLVDTDSAGGGREQHWGVMRSDYATQKPAYASLRAAALGT